MLDQITELQEAGLRAVAAATTTDALEELRVGLLGRKAELPNLLRGVRDLPPDQRGPAGKAANEARQAIQSAIDERVATVAAAELDVRLRAERVDVTLPGRPEPVGGLHLLTRVRRQIEDVFLGLGFDVVEGPETETVHHNFDALNHAPNHPARDPGDTFYLAPSTVLPPLPAAAGAPTTADGGPLTRLLRTHTSPMQVRIMEREDPPVAVIVPGRVYRPDSDATHTPQFHQVEGLWIDVDITLADLKGVLLSFARAIFGEEREIRLRPHFFPFTEPSVEIDVSCHLCGGTGHRTDVAGHPRCGLCKGTGWIEILGSGMVDPNVLTAVGRPAYDPERVQGFAFGMGIERIAMLRYGLDDLRPLYENDLRLLGQLA
ncbi:MAG: phenylalanine--tRNA ligase subunit alpha [Solirubrobacteraceae bacterium]|nr:phenylalanine--tRNA ligase subunit alpha [Solirubrobacteraceae bacterium]